MIKRNLENIKKLVKEDAAAARDDVANLAFSFAKKQTISLTKEQLLDKWRKVMPEFKTEIRIKPVNLPNKDSKFQQLKQKVSSVVDTSKNTVVTAASVTKDKIGSAVDTSKEVTSSLLEKGKEAGKVSFETSKQVLTGGKDKVKGAFAYLKSKVSKKEAVETTPKENEVKDKTSENTTDQPN